MKQITLEIPGGGSTGRRTPFTRGRILGFAALALCLFAGCETTSPARYSGPDSGPTATLSIINGGFRVLHAFQVDSLDSTEPTARIGMRRIDRDRAESITIPAGQPFFYKFTYSQGAGTTPTHTTFGLMEVQSGATYSVYAGPSETNVLQTFVQRRFDDADEQVLEFGEKVVVGQTWSDK